ncbi:type III secretion system translocon subunit SctB, partial [Vibrio alginolyticus]|uniref:type III secretion system translocon subunit SctB n=1 Tax=Vibrio alginolyticus TaxID=663 RepID=UPI001EEAB803
HNFAVKALRVNSYVQATRAQAAKQKADENIGFQEGLLKELRDLFRSISDSQNQAWRASVPTV